MSKNKYLVELPITGVISVEVTAEDEGEALETALQTCLRTEDILEWDVHEHITTGNVFHGIMNSYEISEIEEYE